MQERWGITAKLRDLAQQPRLAKGFPPATLVKEAQAAKNKDGQDRQRAASRGRYDADWFS